MIDFECLRRGSRRGKNEIVREIYSKSMKYCLRQLCNQGASFETAKDLFQDAVVAFIERVCLDQSFTLTVEPKVYLLRIARNKLIDEIRKQQRLPISRMIDVDTQEILDNSLNEVERAVVLQQLMIVFKKKLKPECQSILRAFYFYKQSMREIASAQNITPNSAKTKKSRCIRYLRKIVTNSAIVK